MARLKPTPRYAMHAQWPSLRSHGLAVEYFPRYVHREENLHSIDVVLLSVILRGRGRHLLDDEARPIRGCSVDVTHYGQHHDIVTDARGMEIYNVYLDLRNHPLPILPVELRPTLSAILPIHPRLAHQLNRHISVRMEEASRLVEGLRRIREEMESREPGAREIVERSFQLFLIDLCRAARRTGLILSPAAGQKFPDWVERIRREMDEQPARAVSLVALARSARTSVTYLCRNFKAYTGKTIVAYLLERRIQEAIWKLRTSEDKVLTIALDCGFSDIAHFNRIFKRIARCTPSAYRRGIKGSSPAGLNSRRSPR